MAYQVIARRWRPKQFEQLVGQTHVSQTLLNALKNDRLHHALLFTGPRGTGKTSSARILAMALRCPNDPDGTSQEAQDIAAGRSVDVIEIDGASNNGVDAIRDLRESVGYMPSSGDYKVYIIDEVHMLSTAAFNALLKTLEEPPDHVIFVLATTEVHKIPNTILSRCQRFDFRRIPVRLITDHLENVCKQDGMTASRDALWTIAKEGDGSMRDSLSLLDQVITFSNGDITLEKTSEILGLTNRFLLAEAFEAISNRNTEATFSVVQKLFDSGADAKTFAKDFLEQIRNALFLKTAPNINNEVLDVSDSEADQLRKISASLGEEDLHFLFDMMLKGLQDLSLSSDPRIVLEMLLLRMASAPRITPLKGISLSGGSAEANTTLPQPTATAEKKKPFSKPELPTAVANAQTRPAAQPVQKAAPQQQPRPTAEVPTPKPAMGKVGPKASYSSDKSPQENWFQLVQAIKHQNGLVGAQLENVFLKNKDDKKTLHIGIPKALKFMYEKMNSPQFQNKALQMVNSNWGEGHSIYVFVDDGSPAKEPAKATNMTPKKALELQAKQKKEKMHEETLNHPLVQAINKEFETEIHSIKEKKS